MTSTPPVPGGSTPPTTTPPGEQSGTSRTYKQHDRTEFIILFVWKESTPSDELMKLTEETAPSTSTSPGGMPGGMPGGGASGGSPPGGSSPPGGGGKSDDLSIERGIP
jgi:hypothetical protein